MDQSPGSVAELESLYRQHGPALLLFASGVTGERSGAQDAVHQVFLKLLENGSLHRAADKKAYLFGCVRNAILNQRKREERHRPLDESAWFNPPDQDYAAEQNLRRALAALPDDQRQVVILHVWGELTFSQIADLLEVSSNTAASRYRYALGKLRESMLPKENSCAESG
ncbi:MAG TPA: RNA polymerase sigma factor [Candidatus Sulfotelmatobacter sp.]|nr:RNA polymerase sigma factor [Candidatus Sulfotelmatobacter sp.]